MSIYRDFDAAAAEAAGDAPAFKIGGQEFTTRRRVAYAKYLALQNEIRQETAGGDLDEAAEVDRFFKLVLKPDEYDRLQGVFTESEAVEDEDDPKYVSADQVAQLYVWLLEHYSGKMTGNDEKSNDGPQRIGQSRRRRS